MGSVSIGLEERSSGQRHECTHVAPLIDCFSLSTGLFRAILMAAAAFSSSD